MGGAHSPPRRGGVARSAGVVSSAKRCAGLTTPAAPLRWLRGILLMAQPPLLCEEGNTLGLQSSTAPFLLGLRNDAEIRPRRFPTLRVLLFGFLVGNRSQDDHILPLLPIYRRRHLVFRGELHRIQNTQNFVEVPAGAHRIAEHQFDLLIRTDNENSTHCRVECRSAAFGSIPGF